MAVKALTMAHKLELWRFANRGLDTSFPTASAAVKVLQDLGIVTEMTGQKRIAATATRHTSSCFRGEYLGIGDVGDF